MGTDSPNPTGNLATFLNDIGVAQSEALNTLSDFLGAVADASGAIGGVISLVQAVFNLGGPDPVSAALQQIQNTIQNDFNALGETLRAKEILDRNTTLNGYIAGPQTQLSQLDDEVKAHPSPAEIITFKAPCITALNDLGSGFPTSVWYMTFYEPTYWTDAQTYVGECNYGQFYAGYDVGYGRQAPTPSDDMVFVPTYSLPLYLYAVSTFLGVTLSLQSTLTADDVAILKAASSLLQSVYNNIITNGLKPLTPVDWLGTGIVPIACPGPPSWGSQSGIRLIYSGSVENNIVVGALIEYGAVEKFSGCSSIGGNYQLSLSEAALPGVFNKLQLRVLKRTKDVYVASGRWRRSADRS